MKHYPIELISWPKPCIEWTWKENPPKGPTSHTLQAPGVEEEEVDLDPEEVVLAVTEVKDGPDQKVDSEAEEEDSPEEEDSREGSLTKAPLQRDPVYPVRLNIKTKIDVIIVTKGDTSWPIALREIRLSLQSLPKERSLRIILTPTEVQKNLSWLWPHPCLKPTK